MGQENLEPGEFLVTAYRCRCGHEWVTRPLRGAPRPRMCPVCKSINWDRPRRRRNAGSQEREPC